MAPDYASERATQGTSGQLTKDIMGMSDAAKEAARTRKAAMEANTQQNLNAATGGEGDIQSLSDQIARHLVTKTEGESAEMRSDYMDSLSKRIVQLRKQADEAKKTGNTAAANTFMQVSNILTGHLHKVQGEHAQELLQPPTQPAGGQ